MAQPLLECEGVTKAFGGVRALKGATLAVAPGSVHGLVGHNGAGKSTLMRIVAGLTRRDAGVIRLAGEQVAVADRREAIAKGILSVPQELTVLPGMTVAENICLGAEPKVGPLLSWTGMRRRARATLDRLGVDVGVRRRVDELSPSYQRMVMIAAALSRDCRVLILDEPTAALGSDEAEPLLALIEGLAGHGVTSLYVSHRLDEVARLCDRATVMRDGLVTDTLERGEFTAGDLVSRMVDELPDPPARRGRPTSGPIAVRLRGVRAGALRDADLDIPAGAITGVTGLVGSGADELLQVVTGVIRPEAGRVEIGGKQVRLRSPADALHVGVGYVAGSRAAAGLTELTVRENVLASSLRRAATGGFVLRAPERRRAARFVASLGLESRLEDRLHTLSGGNQQKAIVARLLAAGVRVLVLNDPTAGVDVRARAELHRLLRDAADAGGTVIVRCSEPAELVDLADVIHVVAGGRVVRSVSGADVELTLLLEASASSGRRLPDDLETATEESDQR